jgi:hypothetical protein
LPSAPRKNACRPGYHRRDARDPRNAPRDDRHDHELLTSRSVSRGASERRTIFVAYPYSIPSDDYRRPFGELAKAFRVKFVFADEEITNKQILDKITGMIRASRFSLFDITTWNANVALELGVAVGLQKDYYLLFNPTGDKRDVPSDLGGIDRLQYGTYTELETVLTQLLIQQFGVPSQQKDRKASDQMATLREAALAVVDRKTGAKMRQIADELEIPIELAKAVVRPMVEDGELETRGQTRGMQYYRPGEAPSGS